MTPDIANSAKNLFLVFPAGCGGNHLANLLSIHQRFATRFDIGNTDRNQYNLDMLTYYQKRFPPNPVDNYIPNAHFSELENLQPSIIVENVNKILNRRGIYIFCSHAAEYYYQQDILKPFENRIFCLFSIPEKNKIVKARMMTGPWSLGESLNQSFPGNIPVRELYNIDIFSEINEIPKENIFLIDTDIFFSMEGYEYLKEVLFKNFNITLYSWRNYLFRELHSIYIKHMEYNYN